MEHLAGKRILVTGANGFVGAHLARRLAALAAQVHAMVRPGADRTRLADLGQSITVHEVDIRDAAAIAALIEKIEPEGVFHLAAASQSYGKVPARDDLIDMNIKATIRLMDLTPPGAFFVNTDTFAEVGAKDHPLREDDLLEPTELYGLSRIPATLYGALLGRRERRPVVTVRLFTPYGPLVQKGKLPYEVITRALSDAEIMLTHPEITRDFIYIDDAIEIYLRAAAVARRSCGEVFNAGAGHAVTLREFVALVLAETDSKSVIRWGDQAASYDKARWQADLTKVNRLLDWSPATPLQDGVARTVAWFREHGHYWRS